MSRRRVPRMLAALLALGAAASCGFDRGDRWLSEEPPLLPACSAGSVRCQGGVQRCESGAAGPSWVTVDDCPGRGEVCVAGRMPECRPCAPGGRRCRGAEIVECDAGGERETAVARCEEPGSACRLGACVDLCALAAQQLSNVGCEYWAVDLDNANVGFTLNAAAQQFAVVASNPQPDVDAEVRVELEDSPEAGPVLVAKAVIPPLSLRIFRLGPREVDGSAPGTFDTGTHTALSHAAYRITSSVPIVSYQFNPLENVNVFSNDASLLKPVEALTDSSLFRPAYVVLGWPQTIASTDDPATNFNPVTPADLRSFLTVVGTRPDTRVRVTTATRVIGGGPIPETPAGGSIDIVLQPFDVLNLESDDFAGDFTGSLIEADGPVAVFSGSEAADAPHFETLAERRCCADHLEEQLDPIRTAGKSFAATLSANRSEAVRAAGAAIGRVPQLEWFRVIATSERGARIRTTLDGAAARITLNGRGDWTELAAPRDFVLESDEPVMLGNVSASQDAAGVPRGLPGGDPSLIIVPPIEQYRASYVFLTPDKYSFDFIRIVAAPDAEVRLDGRTVGDVRGCTRAQIEQSAQSDAGVGRPLVVHRCQLSFPVIDPEQQSLAPGAQNDGVHRVESDRNVGVLVDGFDAFVSYGYAAGTELLRIVPE